MRKYEKSLPTAEAVAEKMAEIEREKLLPKGMKIRVFNQRTDLVARHDAQRAAQPGRRHGPGDRRPVHLPGRPGERRHRGARDPAGPSVLDHGPLRRRASRPTCSRSGRSTSGSSSTAR